MYDVVKNDPNYAKISYKNNISAIKNRLSEEVDNRNFNWDENRSSDDEGEEWFIQTGKKLEKALFYSSLVFFYAFYFFHFHLISIS